MQGGSIGWSMGEVQPRADPVSSDAAKDVPEIAGYNVFRIPLSPGSSKQTGQDRR